MWEPLCRLNADYLKFHPSDLRNRLIPRGLRENQERMDKMGKTNKGAHRLTEPLAIG